MRLYIAEKPSLGRAIADVLPKPHQRGEGFIQVANGDVVSWCIGHLLEQAEPETYNPAFKQWRFEHLPIVPEQWKLQPKTKTRKQLTVLRKWVKHADELVHAGDPDREGQLLVDQVLDYLGVKGNKLTQVQRCLINDLNPTAVSRALQQLRPNLEFSALSTSALARSRADWLYGINLTRAYTLHGRKAGYSGVLSVGRVQTPVLGMVVRRDEDIAQFVSKPFYQVLAHLHTNKLEALVAQWQPSDACIPYMDDEGRVLNKALAQNVINRIEGQIGTVSNIEKKLKSNAAPLPYSLSSLQIDAAKRYGFNAKQVLDICQVLYERHKIITYPRSDNRYLPVEHYADAGRVIHAITTNSNALREVAGGVDASIKSRAWNDAKVEAHHAIIPTSKQPVKLSSQEQNVYDLIARQYLCQFYPKWEYTDTTITIIISGGTFIAKSRQQRQLGWKCLFPNKNNTSNENDEPDQYTTSKQLPALKKGDILNCTKAELLEKNTQPPKPFTDASLLAAMTGIARFVNDAETRKILKETDGLGTEATRAGILELLFKRKYLQRKGKNIHATETGAGLIKSLPPVATTPDMTARWEASLEGISGRKMRYKEFMQPLQDTLLQLIQESHLQAVTWTATKKNSNRHWRKKPVKN